MFLPPNLNLWPGGYGERMKKRVCTISAMLLSLHLTSANAAELSFSTNDFARHYNREGKSRGIKGGLVLSGCNIDGQLTACSYPVSSTIRMTTMGSSASARARAIYLEFSGELSNPKALTEVAYVAAAMAWAVNPKYKKAGDLFQDLVSEPGDKPSRTVGGVLYEVEVDANSKLWFKATAQ